ncbi:MAG: zinc-dependent peptidase [Flavobacteriaceae bacterium]|nr:zinc-dependent peptidase [Mangrovimonas sp.]MCB0432139.1 zinc-dependent peptidase [Mangrovimonas sp.]MCB0434845.1 zinc-dependent peptidase [Mangrovimonas sp.]MCB0469785.1 zinc-dependent peptidase [Flavobacteriaceae bacterium]HPF98320.1 zinc-dependent peptidase [Mangrovimonas sp.]
MPTIILREMELISEIILWTFLSVICLMMINYSFKMIELGYVLKYRKPFYVHFYLFPKKLKDSQRRILENSFSFFNKLDPKHQGFFEHRIRLFIKDKVFIGRDGMVIDDEVKTLISATAVMLTFGFRDFYIGLIDKILIYPEAFYSKTNTDYHKGEFNPKLKALVISWEDFKRGFDIANDNLNLGVHEFAHAIHLNSMKERDVSSTIFNDSFTELTELLSSNAVLRQELLDSAYFRNYAYTNQYEFVAVIIETFIETPQEFKAQFPQIYAKTKQMLNFNFANY